MGNLFFVIGDFQFVAGSRGWEVKVMARAAGGYRKTEEGTATAHQSCGKENMDGDKTCGGGQGR